jgi:hypothetical protein
MSEERMRECLVNSIKARALFYHAFYNEFSAEIGPEKTREIMKRAVYKRGLEIGKRFAKFAPSDMAGLKDAFLGFIPDPKGTFNPKLESCSAAGIDIQLTTCPLKDAWQEAGLSDEEVVIMTDIAGAVDKGTFEGAGFSFEPDTWKPGRRGCCRLHIRPSQS